MGQNIIVIPAMNTVVVTSGGGLDMPEINGILTPIVLLSSQPRPANAQGYAELQAKLQEDSLQVISNEADLTIPCKISTQ